MSRIGLLSVAGTFSNSVFKAFVEEMSGLGYDDTRVVYEFRAAGGDVGRLPQLAAELVAIPVDVMVTDGSPAAKAATGVTEQVPIVMATVGDAVAYGLASSLARPGGNVTGFSLLSLDLSSKRFELLREIVPTLSRVGVLWSSANTPLQFEETKSAARTADVAIESGEVKSANEIASAIDRIANNGATAMLVMPEALFWNNRKMVLAGAAAHRWPAVYPEREYADDGGLAAYGPRVTENFRRAAGYVDRILKGTKVGDLPIQQPEKFDFVLNAKSAKAIGVDFPASLLARADEVIE